MTRHPTARHPAPCWQRGPCLVHSPLRRPGPSPDGRQKPRATSAPGASPGDAPGAPRAGRGSRWQLGGGSWGRSPSVPAQPGARAPVLISGGCSGRGPRCFASRFTYPNIWLCLITVQIYDPGNNMLMMRREEEPEL